CWTASAFLTRTSDRCPNYVVAEGAPPLGHPGIQDAKGGPTVAPSAPSPPFEPDPRVPSRRCRVSSSQSHAPHASNARGPQRAQQLDRTRSNRSTRAHCRVASRGRYATYDGWPSPHAVGRGSG